MYRLNNTTINAIEKDFGMSISELENTDTDKIYEIIEKKSHKKLRFLKSTDTRLIGRGSVYTFLNRLLDRDEIDRRLNKI